MHMPWHAQERLKTQHQITAVIINTASLFFNDKISVNISNKTNVFIAAVQMCTCLNLLIFIRYLCNDFILKDVEKIKNVKNVKNVTRIKN